VNSISYRHLKFTFGVIFGQVAVTEPIVILYSFQISWI